MRPETLFDLIASSNGQLCQEPNNVSRISYSLYLLNFEQIELIGCVIKLCRKFLGMCQTIGLWVLQLKGEGGHRGLNQGGRPSYYNFQISPRTLCTILTDFFAETPVTVSFDHILCTFWSINLRRFTHQMTNH